MFPFAACGAERAAAGLAASSLLLLLEIPLPVAVCWAAVLFAMSVALWHGSTAPAPDALASPGLAAAATKPKAADDGSQSDAETESTMGSDPAASETERAAWGDLSDWCSSDEDEGVTMGTSLASIAAGCPCPPGLCRCPEAPVHQPRAPKAASDGSQSDAETESTVGSDPVATETKSISGFDSSDWCSSDEDEDAALGAGALVVAGCPCPPGLCHCREARARQEWNSVATRMASVFREAAASEPGSPPAMDHVHPRRHHLKWRLARGGARASQRWATVGIRMGTVFREVAASEL